MDSHKSDQHVLEELERLKKRATLAWLTGALGVALAMYFALRPTGHLRATSFELIDESGERRGAWELSDGDPLFVLYEAGEPHLSLRVGANGWSSVELRGEQDVDTGTPSIKLKATSLEASIEASTKTSGFQARSNRVESFARVDYGPRTGQARGLLSSAISANPAGGNVLATPVIRPATEQNK